MRISDWSSDVCSSDLTDQARGRGAWRATAPWALFRRGAPVDAARCPAARRWVIKPNNSSASWGVRDAHDRIELARSIAEIHALEHDAIVEPFIDGSDIEVPVITLDGEPAVLPMMIFEQDDPAQVRPYQQKSDLGGQGGDANKRLHERTSVV